MAETENISYHLSEDQVKKVAERIATQLQEEIDRGHHIVPFVIILCSAALVDFWEVFATIIPIQPILNLFFVGFVTEAIPPVILYFFMKQQGWFQISQTNSTVNKYELRIIFWLLSFIDAIPVIEILPLQTFAVLKIWGKIKKRSKAARVERENLEYEAKEQVLKIREVEETLRETEETEVAEEKNRSSIPAPQKVAPEEESRIMEGGEQSNNNGPETKPAETMEEIFIPEEVRDPLGKLKKDFFETPFQENPPRK